MESLFYVELSSENANRIGIALFIVGGVLFVSALVILIYLLTHREGKKSFDGNDWIIALGNKENVKEVSANGSRLTLALVDKEKMDREKLKELGVSSVLVMSDKITLVISGKAEKVAASIQKSL